MEDIFKDAKFGDRFIDLSGKQLIYHKSEKHKSSDGVIWTYHYLIREPEIITEHDILGEFVYAPYSSYVFMDGYGIPSNHKYSDIDRLLESPNKILLIREKLCY